MHPETLRRHVRQAEADQGLRPGQPTTSEREEIRAGGGRMLARFRTLRQRHAVMDGRAVCETVVRSVEPSGEHLAALAVNALIEAEADGVQALAILGRHRDAAEFRIGRIEAAEDLATIYPV